jgi:hypothetical protein
VLEAFRPSDLLSLWVVASVDACGDWCRFRWMAIRVFCMRMWQGTVAAVYFAINWLVYKLDYARSYR